ncbi:glycosyltransferase (GlcNAc), putative [Bodo saltans]|uniref:Glycosyltransferase (GlcNAc), putative n=1 Tax=Bodo saltans TaxID=75058 RepID=A0A0S4J8N2_BODSA|nr:glycosyltransferase (GlcNAc), putative [Bodo saltans]|eukprot:CUG86703.1 glycosyltransferase (GlcNAc), putative [Bodo saltans]
MKSRYAGGNSQRPPTSVRLIATLVFAVVMVGTIAVVYALQGRSSKSLQRRGKSTAEIAEEADALAREQSVRHHAQRQTLLAEAKKLLRALEDADGRIDGAKKVFARFSREEEGNQKRAATNQGSNQNIDGDGDSEPSVDAVFPIQRYEELRNQHKHLGQYHELPGVNVNHSLGSTSSLQSTNITAATTLDNEATIFVGVASYRQSLCAASLSNLFRHASNPRRVYVGLVEIHSPKDAPCLPEELTAGCQLGHFCMTDHVRVRDLEPSETKGLAHGRYLAALLYRGQDFVMLTAMPTFFAPRWDVQLISAYRVATADAIQRRQRGGRSSPKQSAPQVVLTTSLESVDATQTFPVLALDAPQQPPASTNAEGKSNGMMWERTTTTTLCRAEFAPSQQNAEGAALDSTSDLPQNGFAPRGVPRFTAVLQTENSAPPHQPWATMKFLFSNASLLQDVPLDPHLSFVEREAEEDALFSARLWASGYEAYSPGRTVAFQWKNGDETAGSFANDVPSAQFIAGKKATMMRIQYLMHSLTHNSREPIVPDDVVLHEVIVEASAYGVRWGPGALSASKDQEAKWDVAALESRWIPMEHRNLDRWYRYAGLNPVAYNSQKEWCREANRS